MSASRNVSTITMSALDWETASTWRQDQWHNAITTHSYIWDISLPEKKSQGLASGPHQVSDILLEAFLHSTMLTSTEKVTLLSAMLSKDSQVKKHLVPETNLTLLNRAIQSSAVIDDALLDVLLRNPAFDKNKVTFSSRPFGDCNDIPLNRAIQNISLYPYVSRPQLMNQKLTTIEKLAASTNGYVLNAAFFDRVVNCLEYLEEEYCLRIMSIIARLLKSSVSINPPDLKCLLPRLTELTNKPHLNERRAILENYKTIILSLNNC